MAHVRRTTGIQRVMVLATVIALAFGAGSAFVAYGTSGPQGTAFFGCLTKGGILYNMSVGTAMDCKPNDQAINWMSYTPTALDATFVNEGQGDSITTGMIANGQVMTSDLADDSVISGKIVNGTINQDDLGNASVENAEIASNAVTSDKVQDGTLTQDDLGTNSVGTDEINNGSIGRDDLGLDSVESQHVMNGEIRTQDLATGAVTADKIDTSTVQHRVSGTCSAGQTISAVNEDGTVTCQAPGSSLSMTWTDWIEVPSPGSKTASVSCPAGSTATGGGVDTANGDIKVRESYPTGTSGGATGWTAQVRNDDPFHYGDMRVYVLCSSGT